MAITRRELVLRAITDLIAAVPEFATVERNPVWVNKMPPLPAAAVYDGPERSQDQNSRDQQITTSVQIEVLVSQKSLLETTVDLNAKMGLVQQAVAVSQTLGGLAYRIRYIGCDQPEIPDLTASPCEGRLSINFEIDRLQTYASPYQ
jgi:hypothetical protein